jgi:chromosome segregation protein
MRLQSIKLAGFKSFVDPTTIPFPSNLSAVVGPNGCGKSNVIDAVRWVMGESSAKQLRGESLDDVIFNGSAGRKPVGQAAIELNFDNSDGTLVGQYASFAEISIRREITREGQSNYYLNGTRCRRRDIIDIFLGTGLGPRSYAIIEQGMISRFIEAKPDDMRAFLEEAAGISKYKERRHETELRIHHTRENLARLNDLREELSKQLNHLQRQANAAERYKVLKQEERLVRAQILVLRWTALHDQLQIQNENIQREEIQLSETLAQQTEIETELTAKRELQTEVTAQNNEVQARYYQLGNEIAKIEQSIKHQAERFSQFQHEQTELEQNKQKLSEQLSQEETRYSELTDEVNNGSAEIEAAQEKATLSHETLLHAEQALHDWQVEWEMFTRQFSQAEQEERIEQTRIQHLQQHVQTVEQRMARLQQEYAQQTESLKINSDDELELELQLITQKKEETEFTLQDILQNITSVRESSRQTLTQLDQAKSQMQTLQGQQASLEALQKAALGQNEELVVEWLEKQQLANNQRLAQLLQVENGWELAVETVLEKYLQAVCVDEFDSLETLLQNLPQGKFSFVKKTQKNQNYSSSSHQRLLTKIQSPFALTSLLNDIYIAENLAQALQILPQLAEQESVVTRDGLWIGKNWLLVSHKTDANSGILKRERDINILKNNLAEVICQVHDLQNALQEGQNQLQQLEQQRESVQHQLAELRSQQSNIRTKQEVLKARLEQAHARAQQIHSEIEDCNAQLTSDQKALEEARESLQISEQKKEQCEEQRESLTQIKLQYQTAQEMARSKANHDKEAAHQLALRLQAARLQLETSSQHQVRFKEQLEKMNERETYLQTMMVDNDQPVIELKTQLSKLKEEHVSVTAEFTQLRVQLEELDQSLRQLEKHRHEIEEAIEKYRSALEQTRLSGQALTVRSHTLQEQMTESGYELEAVQNEMPQEANEKDWEDQLTGLMKKIDRLGAINLAAIDEFAAIEERKTNLDTQYTDLTTALETLEDAMSKMDGETRSRFKETFDQVNLQFQTIFPRLFGGGRASLDLAAEDLLSSGITIMAQPPGKRNSTIHLLSGGEKALTAIALVFAFFHLNPAPFCMLDEVDAPLDDANVMRFCKLVKEMSEKIQFIFISHNKLAIEMAQHLAGVTMNEPGVSRLVSVDVDQAIAMAEA